MTAAIEVEDVRKLYPSRTGEPVQALNEVSFRVREGGVSGLLGPNGAGKTTLVKIMSTITKPTSGRAAICGLDVTQQPLAVRRKMAVVLQQTAAETLLNIRDNLLIYAYLHGLEPREANKRTPSPKNSILPIACATRCRT
ncbi:MAG: ATP-binding cassette domain-containing protein [Burkholderiales bacterium]